ncbi:MAG: ATP-sensitive inward rectifier potassium channel 10 [Synechococcales cyanobacterium RM1_1_8]|nr:ATP-sensitive inward rectifier potassium channel 10 [Synechococcales cyanobacterium RM1_1_8]
MTSPRPGLFRTWFELPHIVRLRASTGRFEALGLNQWQAHWRDPYHLLLMLPWQLFFLVLLGGYLAVNTLFALAYVAQPGGIENAAPGSILDTFFFSVQTLGSIGYGAMYPTTIYTHSIVALESMVGIVSIAMITGLAFARFSRSDARVVFSDVAVVEPHDGRPTLVFRTANRRRNQILEATLKVYLIQDEVTLEGLRMRRFYELGLLRRETPQFVLSWTVMHVIDGNSPLHRATLDSLRQKRGNILVSLSGLDETIMQPIHARHTYAAEDIRWDHRFVDMIYEAGGGDRFIDYRYFNLVEPIPASGDG